MAIDTSPPFYLFEDNQSTNKKKSFCFSAPEHEIIAEDYSQLDESFLKLEELNQKGYFLAGHVAYEAGMHFLGIPPIHPTKIPLLHFHAFSKKSLIEMPIKSLDKLYLHQFKRDLNFPDYLNAFQKVQSHLHRGDTYQVNLSLREYFKGPSDSFALYQALREIQKVRYAAYVSLDQFDLLSFSPELFLQKEHANLTSLPMKGTSQRSGSHNTLDLTKDYKSISENTMIVDLIRNDMSLIAERGSVRANKMCYTEQYETLTQMVSEVSCTIPKDMPFSNIFKALFPCGSITGAPKKSTTEIISKLEATSRGIYTGSIGYIEPNRDFLFNVAIRTIIGDKKGNYTIGLGSGVLSESDAQEEHNEIWLKSKFIKTTNSHFTLFETLRLENHTLVNLNLHLDRLSKSADYFGFFFDLGKVLEKVQPLTSEEGYKRCKIILSYDGSIRMEIENLPELTDSPTVSINSNLLNSSDIFLRHKTSKRELYTQEHLIASKDGLYDTLFFNEKKELCEASRHNIFLKLNGDWITPSIDSGILPGIQRSLTIKRLDAVERVIYEPDLLASEKILLTNSLRGETFVSMRFS